MKLKHFLALLPILANITFSQELDPAFLESLPDNVRQDFLKRSAEDVEDKKYASPDTRMRNLEAALEKAEDDLKRIKSNIVDEKVNKTDLKRFGESFFSSFQTSFMPINEPNFNSDYTLDVGDQLNILLVGQINDDLKVYVQRDGSISIDKLGKVIVSGLTLQTAIDIIKQRISDTFIATEGFVSLTGVRDTSILIVGNVSNPGMYVLPGGSNALGGINAAGGIKHNGSFRNILHKRGDQTISVIDLYEIFLFGDLKSLKPLRSGDALVIQNINPSIQISGGVINPAIYEIKPEESLSTILQFAGIRNIDNSTIYIERNKNLAYTRLNIDTSVTDPENVSLVDGDSIEVPYVETKFNQATQVTISGEVNIPGSFTLNRNAKLSDLIELAGGYKDTAFPLGGVFLRKSIKELELQFKEKGYNELIQFISSQPSQRGLDGNSLITVLSLLRNFEPAGRLVTEFEISKLQGNPLLDRVLENGDKIHIPKFNNQVYVFGEVINPTSIAYQSNQTVSEYIEAAGGYSRFADDSRIIITYPDGNSRSYSPGLFNSLKGENLIPGTVIYVPRYIGKVDGISLAGAVAPILSSFALSVASLNSINN